MRRPALLLLPLFLACAHLPPPHPRAVESNQQCAEYIAQNDLVKAETYCDLALEFSPQYAEAWTNKGLIALKRHQMDVAKDDFIRALHYNQELAQAYNDLCYVYLQEGAFNRAHDNCARALKVNPDFPEARHNLALAYMGLRKWGEAKKELRTLIAVAPNLADPHNSLGIILARQGDREEAVNEFLTATQLDPSFADAYLNLGNTYSELGKYNECSDAFSSCLKADPDNIACRQNLPICNRMKSLSDPRLQTEREELAHKPSAAGYYQMGQMDHERGLRAEEERDYRRCVQVDGRYVPCHYALYLLFKEDQKTANANAACTNVLKFASVEDFPAEVDDCRKYLNAP